MPIKNFNELSTSPFRRAVLSIAEEGYAAINTQRVVLNSLKYSRLFNSLKIQGTKYSLDKYKRVRLLGIGKAAGVAADAVKQVLKGRLSDGYVIDVEAADLGPNIISRAGTHPLASEKNRLYTEELFRLFSDCSEKDLVVCIISGGGSALLCAPYRQTPEQEAEIFKALTAKGATIYELNTVRKHTSQSKGGFLAKALYPAKVASLVFSDIPGDELSMVASGPTIKDPTTARDASAILEKYHVLESLKRPKVELVETPKEDKYFEKTRNFLMTSSRMALKAMRRRAEDLGFKVRIFSEEYQGEARILGKEVVEDVKPGECLLGTGESTVKLLGRGKGGRNQEMALGGALGMDEKTVLGCFASDGHDNTEAAGAIADFSTLSRAAKLGLKPEAYLASNDSFSFFEATGDLVFTGLTGSNVADFFVCLKR